MGTETRFERDATRDQILDAARELFVDHGYDAVSMRKIAARVGITPTAIYFHFRDKETLFRELCADDFLALRQQLAGMAEVEDPAERLRLIGYAYIDFAIEHPHRYRLMFMTPNLALAPEDSILKHGNPEEDAYAFVKATVAEGIAAGRFLPELCDPELLAQLAWGAAHGIVSLHIAKRNDPWVEWRPARETARMLIDAAVHGFTCRETH